MVASAAFNSARVETWPAPVPKVITWLAPPLTATVRVEVPRCRRP